MSGRTGTGRRAAAEQARRPDRPPSDDHHVQARGRRGSARTSAEPRRSPSSHGRARHATRASRATEIVPQTSGWRRARIIEPDPRRRRRRCRSGSASRAADRRRQRSPVTDWTAIRSAPRRPGARRARGSRSSARPRSRCSPVYGTLISSTRRSPARTRSRRAAGGAARAQRAGGQGGPAPRCRRAVVCHRAGRTGLAGEAPIRRSGPGSRARSGSSVAGERERQAAIRAPARPRPSRCPGRMRVAPVVAPGSAAASAATRLIRPTVVTAATEHDPVRAVAIGDRGQRRAGRRSGRSRGPVAARSWPTPVKTAGSNASFA